MEPDCANCRHEKFSEICAKCTDHSEFARMDEPCKSCWYSTMSDFYGIKCMCSRPCNDFDQYIRGDVLPDDQKAKADAGKPKLTLVPHQIIYDIARVREYGNAKYPEGGPDNWKQVDIQRYRDALFRHLLLYLDDPKGVDEESGISHLSHLACNCAFLCELEERDCDE